jgi:hypothetical protein
MWDAVLVVVVVAVCAGLIGRTFYRQFTGKGSCGCSCRGGGCAGGKLPDKGCGCPPPEEPQR